MDRKSGGEGGVAPVVPSPPPADGLVEYTVTIIIINRKNYFNILSNNNMSIIFVVRVYVNQGRI